MIARWTCAGLMAALLAAFVSIGGASNTQAGDTKTAIFAGGCFWCMEDAFDKVEGVTETISGYAGGETPKPTYGSHKGYVEALKVTYDPAKVTYAELLDNFWRNIDPFDDTGQFCDKGPAYRTAVFVSDDAEKTLAEETKEEITKRFGKDVVTEIRDTSTFYPAEDYHQDYHTENPVSYKYYKWNCGREQRLTEIWGAKSS